jgi:hypothetical protein
MGIENTLERIAASLEKLADLGERTREHQTRLLACAEFHAHKAGMEVKPEKTVAAVMEAAEVTAEPEAPAAPAAPEFTYDELKAKLIERGVEIPKGTKMTTLLKLWEKHKDAPVAPAEPETDEAPAEPETDEAPAADADPFGDAPVDPLEEAPLFAGIPRDLDPVKAREVIQKYYDRSPADCTALKKALSFVGAAAFGEIPAGKHGVVLARYLELKKINPKDVEL